jgi:predicted metal-dependent hydrolase
MASRAIATNGRMVRVAVPLVVNDETVRLAVIDKLGWIRQQKVNFFEQPRQTDREKVNGERHYFLGPRYRLRVNEQDGPARVAVRGVASLALFVRPGTSTEQREDVLLHWYRAQLKGLQPGRQAPLVHLEMAKKPVMCLEYIVVHELIHLLVRNHTERFTALMNGFMPNWGVCRQLLNSGVLGQEDWKC